MIKSIPGWEKILDIFMGLINQLVGCDICYHIFQVDAHTLKAKFLRCRVCDAVHQVSLKNKTLKLILDNRDENIEDQDAEH